MRVIAGRYRGRVLKTVPDLSVRPATDRVKSAIFNVLQSRVDWSTATVLDLFAGSGSIGLEAMSRGADKCVFVEQSRSALAFLKQNIDTVGAGSGALVVAGDVFGFLKTAHKRYEAVFADPPYALENLNELPNIIFGAGVVAEEGYLIIEHPAGHAFTPGPAWETAVEKSYGRTCVSFFVHRRAPQ